MPFGPGAGLRHHLDRDAPSPAGSLLSWADPRLGDPAQSPSLGAGAPPPCACPAAWRHGGARVFVHFCRDGRRERKTRNRIGPAEGSPYTPWRGVKPRDRLWPMRSGWKRGRLFQAEAGASAPHTPCVLLRKPVSARGSTRRSLRGPAERGAPAGCLHLQRGGGMPRALKRVRDNKAEAPSAVTKPHMSHVGPAMQRAWC
ncbi:hypothetical protein HJG60_008339 [Phyllostomus discolor]|uniref:Uncharacterized protein n=1 Tax=Phyllostomus discolor TaxID=89673 RepID=A0A833ZCU1_9CHIR|nr:hypothetical protein HJG60_008339 [Phyllostomus discolor]